MYISCSDLDLIRGRAVTTAAFAQFISQPLHSSHQTLCGHMRSGTKLKTRFSPTLRPQSTMAEQPNSKRRKIAQ